MKKRYVDPFSPDLPIDDPNKFSGRAKEVDSIVDSLFQLLNENPVHTIITGDRGIGKSSLLVQVKKISEGDNVLPDKLQLDKGVDRYNFTIAWHDCATDQKPVDLAAGILEQLQNKFSKIWDKFNLELDIAGFVKISERDNSISSITSVVNHFCTQVKKAAAKANEKKSNGIILFFDELDRVNSPSGIATFFKLSAERLSRDGVKNVAFFSAGITGAIQNLEEEHGSIYRTFKDVPLPRLEEIEVNDILDKGFTQVQCTYDKSVVKDIYKISAGYPEPVHLLGSQMLKVDSDNKIDHKDFLEAKKQTVESLRRNKLASLLKKAGSGKYQKVLEAMASYHSLNVPLSYISGKIGYEQNQYSTNMSNLLKRNIITAIDRGIYSFTDPLLKEYIARFGVIDTGDDE